MKNISSILLLACALCACSKSESPSALVAPSASAPVAIEPVPEMPELPTPVIIKPGKPTLVGLECAERIILLAAKKNVAQQFDNRPTSGGVCALGVRTSLQKSRVGDISGTLGNAIDYIHNLKPHGYVDSGLRDPRTAPPGSVIIFSGPKTAEYFRTGRMGRPAGNWVGHVTIKGDDGRYYTDGRTREPAKGWENNRNQAGVRNVAGIFVPGSNLAGQYDGKCSKLKEQEAFLSLVLAANDAHVLDFFDEKAEAEGKLLVREGLEQMEHLGERASREESFTQVLRLALEAGPYDDEAELAEVVHGAVSTERSLRLAYEAYVHALPRGTAVEQCKAERLEAEMGRMECLSESRVKGQDMDEFAAQRCARPFAYANCLRAKL